MSICADCNAIVQHVRYLPDGSFAQGHQKLKETHITGYKPFAQAGVVVKHYECSSCGTKWKHENDKNDPHVGWSFD
jgi:hypothetical protein